MNKKKIIYALCFGMALLFAGSCRDNTEEKPPTGSVVEKMSGISANIQYINKTKKDEKDVLDSTDFNKADFSLVKERIMRLSTCVGSYCSDTANYCGNDTCLQKIKDCHTIDSITFERLTGYGGNGHAVFRYNAGIGDLLRTADCRKYIKLTCSAISYSIDTVSTVNATLPNTAHYSVALWQQIAKNPIDSVEVFKAIYDPTTKKYLIPFKVYFSGGKWEVYDVSNDYP
ncbi:hypothetical protein F0919_07750 [Taibaiella lutea]|uniref:Lipoprotein n=1 Tax=Taibaiella lutea TaxID=2608001 RepID=A0A5M6CHP4_9BACT|nr:hypothetical protein [Taibaiella lutea]KAA5534506.1 hypothetical protein F0919_07750 [Taibaiella lutea]